MSTDNSDPNTENIYTVAHPYNTLIVFGEGPVKPILLETELTSEQKSIWECYQSNPNNFPEPDFFLMQQQKSLGLIDKIKLDKELSNTEKNKAISSLRAEWQRTGWFAMRSWGRQNALAAGYALYTGLTEKVILTGGKTMPQWVKEIMPSSFAENWPSEATLMANIVVSYYGDLYQKRYGCSIGDGILLEEDATNTLENFAYSINKYPYLTSQDHKIGLLSANHHLTRISELARLFSLTHACSCGVSTQSLLEKMQNEPECCKTTQIQNNTSFENIEISKNSCLIKGLQNPEYLTYWLGYVSLVNNPTVIQNLINQLKKTPWREAACKALKKMNLNFDEYADLDILVLASQNPDKYGELVQGMQRMRDPLYRVIPSLQ